VPQIAFLASTATPVAKVLSKEMILLKKLSLSSNVVMR